MTEQKKGAPLEEARLSEHTKDSGAKGEESNAIARKLSAPSAPSSLGLLNSSLLGACVKR